MTLTQTYRKTPKGVLTNIYDSMKYRSLKTGRPAPNFTLKEFHDRFLNNEKFIKLFQAWEGGGYKYYDKPSFDRIDPDKPYTFDNIQLLTWKENRIKGDKENASRITTPVLMFSRNNEFETMFESVNEAVQYTGLSQGCIVMCCQGKRNYVGSHIFRYRGDKFRKHHENPELLKGRDGE